MVSVTPRPRFNPGKRTLVPIVQEPGWAPEPVWTLRLEEKYLAFAGISKIYERDICLCAGGRARSFYYARSLHRLARFLVLAAQSTNALTPLDLHICGDYHSICVAFEMAVRYYGCFGAIHKLEQMCEAI
jgi:hypothetical protein